MTTEVARAGDNSSAVAPLPRTADVIQINEWAAELDAAHRLASMLAAANFLPMTLRKKSNGAMKTEQEAAVDATAVILAGKSVGMDPMQAVQNIFPVHGMPSMYARTMQGLVLAAGHDVEFVESDETHATVRARRKGREWREYTWTIDRARKAGYLSNKKYDSDPRAMLTAKALAEACRLTAPDVLLGMAYSAEERELEDLGETTPAAPAIEKPKTKVSRKSAPKAPAPELPAAVMDAPREDDEAEEVEVEAAAAEPMASKDQIDALVAALTAAGFTTAAQRTAAITEALGEPRKPAEMTAEEADVLTATFEAKAQGADAETGELFDAGQ